MMHHPPVVSSFSFELERIKERQTKVEEGSRRKLRHLLIVVVDYDSMTSFGETVICSAFPFYIFSGCCALILYAMHDFYSLAGCLLTFSFWMSNLLSLPVLSAGNKCLKMQSIWYFNCDQSGGGKKRKG